MRVYFTTLFYSLPGGRERGRISAQNLFGPDERVPSPRYSASRLRYFRCRRYSLCIKPSEPPRRGRRKNRRNPRARDFPRGDFERSFGATRAENSRRSPLVQTRRRSLRAAVSARNCCFSARTNRASSCTLAVRRALEARPRQYFERSRSGRQRRRRKYRASILCPRPSSQVENRKERSIEPRGPRRTSNWSPVCIFPRAWAFVVATIVFAHRPKSVNITYLNRRYLISVTCH